MVSPQKPCFFFFPVSIQHPSSLKHRLLCLFRTLSVIIQFDFFVCGLLLNVMFLRFTYLRVLMVCSHRYIVFFCTDIPQLMDIVSSFRLLWLKLLWISFSVVWYIFCISLGCASFQLYVLFCCLKWLYLFILPSSVCDWPTCWTNSLMAWFSWCS